MKRFLAFRNSIYYAAGGMNDFLGDFDTFEEAQEAVRGGTDKWEKEYWKTEPRAEWGHVWDSDTRENLPVDNHPICGHY